ncbi:MAG TPA: hypothetical protein VFC78_06050 [Tepidisphaeraceae bacterium]|nr:hypothetical protein [Tepidisphaeraceae bacterium]
MACTFGVIASAQSLPVEFDPFGRATEIVIAKAIKHDPTKTHDEAARWHFTVLRTLEGTDVTGDPFSVTADSKGFAGGQSYIMYVSPGGYDDCAVEKFLPAAVATVKSLVKEIAASGGAVHSKLQLWGRYGGFGGAIGVDIHNDGRFRLEAWTYDARNGSKYVGGWAGKLTRAQIDALTRSFASATATRAGGDAPMRSTIGWRDKDGVAHEKEYNEVGHAPDLWAVLHRLAKENGKPLPAPQTQPAATQPGTRAHIRHLP